MRTSERGTVKVAGLEDGQPSAGLAGLNWSMQWHSRLITEPIMRPGDIDMKGRQPVSEPRETERPSCRASERGSQDDASSR